MKILCPKIPGLITLSCKLILVILLISGTFTSLYAQNNNLLTAWTGTIDQNNLTVSNLPANGKVIQLLSASTASDSASIQVLNNSNQTVNFQADLVAGMKIRVTAYGGAAKEYALLLNGTSLSQENIINEIVNTSLINNRLINFTGNVVYHVSAATNPLKGSFINISSDNVWLYFDNIRPAAFNSRYLAHIAINGQLPLLDSTVRLVQYAQGCVLISQSAAFQPLEVFTAASFGGSSMKMGLYNYYKSPDLAAFNNTINSFKLKKGYMATFAENDNGTGASKVYIAADSDLLVPSLPDTLKNKISFVRVFPWRWVSKKGWTNTTEMADTLGAKWRYNWNNNDTATLDMEYVPIRQTQYWPGLPNNQKNVTHLLGYNEPDKSDQANMTVEQAIGAWPELMGSGVRLGSPAVSDGGTSWLYSFIDKADSAGYRVDFIAVHFYRGCQSAGNFYSFLKDIHDRTGRPIWITEFNNGANWTNTSGCPKPTYAQDSAAIRDFINMLDTTSFVERYALYEWVEDTRQLFFNESPVVLNPAGKVYKNDQSPLAYNSLQEPSVYPEKHPFSKGSLVVSRFGNTAYAQPNANPIYVDEYTTGGTLKQSIPLPVIKAGANYHLVSSSTPTINSDGQITLSPDSRYVSISGYMTAVGSSSNNTNASTAASIPRVMALLDSNGIINSKSAFNDVVSSHVLRGVVVKSDTLCMAGGSSAGLRVASFGKGTVQSSLQTFTTPGGLRKVQVFGNDLYFSQYTAGLSKMYQLPGSALAGGTPVALAGIPQTSASTVATAFAMFDMDASVPGYDLLYLADETPTPNIQKYAFDGTTWVSKGTYTITGLNDNLLHDMTGVLVNGVPTLYAVSFTSIVKFEDVSGSYTSNISITATSLVNNTVGGTSAFRGIAFAPGTSVITSPSQALPVVLTDFEASLKERTVILSWTTATETNNQGFYVERSFNGNNWQSIGYLPSKAINGTTAAGYLYTLTDEKPVVGIQYYRLKQVDKDGRFTYSSTREITLGQVNLDQLMIYPNPANTIARIKGIGKATIIVRDMLGRQMNVTCLMAGDDVVINVTNLAAGIYSIEAINGNNKLYGKLQK